LILDYGQVQVQSKSGPSPVQVQVKVHLLVKQLYEWNDGGGSLLALAGRAVEPWFAVDHASAIWLGTSV